VHAEAVTLTWLHIGQVSVPAEGRALWQFDPRGLSLLVEEAQLDPLGHF
jgi:hypothetical protein